MFLTSIPTFPQILIDLWVFVATLVTHNGEPCKIIVNSCKKNICARKSLKD